MNTFIQPINAPMGPGIYRLVRDYTYKWEKGGVEYEIVIPAGFEYDGASVPRIVWTLAGIVPDGLIRGAALVHDYIYRYKGKFPPNRWFWRASGGDLAPVESGKSLSRAEADALFYRIMREAGMSRYRAALAYVGVRAFGMLSW